MRETREICFLSVEQHKISINFYESFLKKSGFTMRQSDVLILLGKGFSNKKIAKMLNVSENTIKVHISAIFKILGVHNRTQAALEMQQILFKTLS